MVRIDSVCVELSCIAWLSAIKSPAFSLNNDNTKKLKLLILYALRQNVYAEFMDGDKNLDAINFYLGEYIVIM